jgi:hypothetical protein
MPVQDHSTAQLLENLGESHILDRCLAGTGFQHATWSPERSDLRGNPSEALEDCFVDQHLAVVYCIQLKMRTQRIRESLQELEFATAVEQLAHRACPELPQDHVRREAGKAFADGVEDPDIKIQLLLGGKKTLRQALELNAVFLAAKPQKTSASVFC